MKNEYDAKWFEEVVYLPFENAQIPAPVGYDEYLKMAFGDYMTPPPKNEQIPKHDAVEIDVNRSYKKYIGENND